MDNNQEKLKQFLEQIKQQSIFPQCMRQAGKTYEINVPQLIKLNSEEILRLRSIIITKRQNEPEFKEKMEVQWNQCEKKIFNWIAICFSYLNAKSLRELSDEDLDYISSITSGKSLPLIKYHICTLMKQQSRPKWSEKQDKILYQILAVEKKFKTQGEWILVSKQLFLRGDHIMYKSAKICRQRWFNHIDPALSKQWTAQQDRTMLQFIKKQGKKWAFISNKLNHAKNEHMIKNRFNSLLKKQQKINEEELQQQELINKILKRYKSQIVISPKKVQQQKKVKIQIKEKPVSCKKQQKQPEVQMKLISSFQFQQALIKDNHQNHFPFVLNNQNQLDASKFFKQQQQQKDLKASQLLKMSQSFSYNNMTYPSPIPVTPSIDLFNQNPSSPNFKNNFKLNLHDFVGKSIQ